MFRLKIAEKEGKTDLAAVFLLSLAALLPPPLVSFGSIGDGRQLPTDASMSTNSGSAPWRRNHNNPKI